MAGVVGAAVGFFAGGGFGEVAVVHEEVSGLIDSHALSVHLNGAAKAA